LFILDATTQMRAFSVPPVYYAVKFKTKNITKLYYQKCKHFFQCQNVPKQECRNVPKQVPKEECVQVKNVFVTNNS
jgi:hypothetical protein